MYGSAGSLIRWVRTEPGLGIVSSSAAVMAIAAGVWLLRRLRRESPEAIECARRLRVHAVGRIAAGELVDLIPVENAANEAGLAPTVVYQYEVGGVTYEVSQALHLVAAPLPGSWIPGLPVQVKYDPANPGNSIVACEHWSGLAPLNRSHAAGGALN